MAHFIAPRTILGETVCCDPATGFALLASSTEAHQKFFVCCALGATFTMTAVGAFTVEVLLNGVVIDTIEIEDETLDKTYVWSYSPCGNLVEVKYTAHASGSSCSTNCTPS